MINEAALSKLESHIARVDRALNRLCFLYGFSEIEAIQFFRDHLVSDPESFQEAA